MAYSAGGYYAPRAAAFEKRYRAVVAWGAHYDYHAVWVKRCAEEGGAEHCQVDNRQVGIDYIADWLAARL